MFQKILQLVGIPGNGWSICHFLWPKLLLENVGCHLLLLLPFLCASECFNCTLLKLMENVRKYFMYINNIYVINIPIKASTKKTFNWKVHKNQSNCTISHIIQTQLYHYSSTVKLKLHKPIISPVNIYFQIKLQIIKIVAQLPAIFGTA